VPTISDGYGGSRGRIETGCARYFSKHMMRLLRIVV